MKTITGIGGVFQSRRRTGPRRDWKVPLIGRVDVI